MSHYQNFEPLLFIQNLAGKVSNDFLWRPSHTISTKDASPSSITMITALKARKQKEKKTQDDRVAAPKNTPKKLTPSQAKRAEQVAQRKAEKERRKAELASTKREGEKENNKWRWEKSWAKEILRQAVYNGDITTEHSYDEIHAWHPEVQSTDRSKLPGRMRGLREQVLVDSDEADKDALALAHDRKLYKVPTHNYRGEPRWEGSDAQKKLKMEIAQGVHLTMSPADFACRAVFQDYPEDVIREHIYQEIKFQKYCKYRNDAKKKSMITLK